MERLFRGYEKILPEIVQLEQTGGLMFPTTRELIMQFLVMRLFLGKVNLETYDITQTKCIKNLVYRFILAGYRDRYSIFCAARKISPHLFLVQPPDEFMIPEIGKAIAGQMYSLILETLDQIEIGTGDIKQSNPFIINVSKDIKWYDGVFFNLVNKHFSDECDILKAAGVEMITIKILEAVKFSMYNSGLLVTFYEMDQKAQICKQVFDTMTKPFQPVNS